MITASPVPRRSRVVPIGGAAIALALVWWAIGGDDRATTTAGAGVGTDHVGAPGWTVPIRRLPDGTWGRARSARDHDDPRADGLVRVRGKVYDARGGAPVGGVEVVFSGADGEADTTAAADGTYVIDVAAGAYRAFVRGDGVMSVGAFAPERLPGPPTAAASAPLDSIAPLVAVTRDERGIDLAVELGGVVTGRVVDRAGHPVAHALVRARGEVRPVLGTDVAETDAAGAYRLELPSGVWEVDASHPDYGGLDHGQTELDLLPGTRATTLDLTLVAGCIIRGHVVGADGKPSGDGAIEGREPGGEFGPIGRIDPDGSFRFQTAVATTLELRAWPWKAPPSRGQTFTCSEGARFTADFQIGKAAADLDGVITTADGTPAAGAFIDVLSISGGGESQQERADADGTWAVYAMPPGDYMVSAQVPGHGAVSKKIHVPAHGVALALGGTGAIAGTVAGVPDGTLAMRIGACDDTGAPDVPTTQLVPVHDGRFRIEGVPACTLFVATSAGGRSVGEEVHVAAGADAAIALDLTPPRKVTVRGRVVDGDGHRVGGALVRVWSDDGGMEQTESDERGDFTIEAEVGAEVVANANGEAATATVPADAGAVYATDLQLRPDDESEHSGPRDDGNEPDDGPVAAPLVPAPSPTQPGDDPSDHGKDRGDVQID